MALSDLVIPAAATAVSVAVTWRFCLRPMRDGQHCGMGSTRDGATLDPAVAEERAAEIARLRMQVKEMSAAAITNSDHRAVGRIDA